jgi:peflin
MAYSGEARYGSPRYHSAEAPAYGGIYGAAQPYGGAAQPYSGAAPPYGGAQAYGGAAQPYQSPRYAQAVPQGADPQLWQWFNAVDADRSGSISVNELQAALVNGALSMELGHSAVPLLSPNNYCPFCRKLDQ